MAEINPTPIRQRLISFLTPDIRDFIVAESVDTTKKTVPAFGTAHPDPLRFPHHVFCWVVSSDPKGLMDTWLYIKQFDDQDNYNFEWTSASWENKYDTVVRTYVRLRETHAPETSQSKWGPNTPAIGSAMGNVPAGLFDYANFALVGRQEVRSPDKELDSIFVIDRCTYAKRCAQRQLGVDDLNGKMLTATSNLYYGTEVVTGSTTAAQLFANSANAYWGLQSDGTKRTGRQLSCNWYEIITETVVGGTFSGSMVTVDTFTTNDNYYWPPVLDPLVGIDLMDWERLDNGVDVYPAFRFLPEGYQGPCLNTIVRTWSVAPQTIPVVGIMQPTRIYYASPYFTLNISECLHTTIFVQCDIGSSDPVYDENTGSRRYFSETNFTTWPATIIAYDEQVPFRGGYLRTTRTIAKPPVPPNVNWLTGAPI